MISTKIVEASKTLKRTLGRTPPVRLVRESVGVVCDIFSLLMGAAIYGLTGSTPVRALLGLINLHCRTRGRSNDLLHRMVQVYRPPRIFPHANGVLGNLTTDEVKAIAGQIQKRGYYIFPTLLPTEVCDRLREFASSTACTPRPARNSVPKTVVYDRRHLLAETYHFDEQTLLDNGDVQALLSDLSILAVAQAYLDSQPVLDIVTMWWSTTYSKEANVEVAQLYHFDMDRIKWIKIFFYLTDVTPETGPHCYVARSHRRNGQPRELLRHGYARITDDEIRRYYPQQNFLEFTGRRGTIIAEDTRGFHKGKPLVSGDRLILELEFCDSLFGAKYQPGRLKQTYSPQLLDAARSYPRIYSKFVLEKEAV